MCFIMIITSLDNNTIKTFARLKEKKYRDNENSYLIEGYRSVKDSIAFAINPRLLFAQSAYEKFAQEFDGVPCVVCADNVFSKISDTVTTQGVICIADKNLSIPTFTGKKALLLDRVRDPGNMGTIIRTALATGFKDIYCVDCVDVYNPKVVRSAMSAVSRVQLYETDSSIISSLKDNGYRVICADMDGENIFSISENFDKICLAIGNEANGLSDELFALADKTVSLPMEDGESLNAGVSAAVLMYMFSFGLKK